MNPDQVKWFDEQCERFKEAFEQQDDDGKATMMNEFEKLIDNTEQ